MRVAEKQTLLQSAVAQPDSTRKQTIIRITSRHRWISSFSLRFETQ